MSPTLLLVVLSAIGIAIFVYGVLLMSRRQEGGSARSPALLMIAGIAMLAIAMLSALMVKWTETSPTQPHFEIPGTGVGDPAAAPPTAVPTQPPLSSQTTPQPAPPPAR